MMKKIFINILLLASFSAAYGFDEGFIWALKANFNGTATMPSISKDDLDRIAEMIELINKKTLTLKDLTLIILLLLAH